MYCVFRPQIKFNVRERFLPIRLGRSDHWTHYTKPNKVNITSVTRRLFSYVITHVITYVVMLYRVLSKVGNTEIPT